MDNNGNNELYAKIFLAALLALAVELGAALIVAVQDMNYVPPATEHLSDFGSQDWRREAFPVSGAHNSTSSREDQTALEEAVEGSLLSPEDRADFEGVNDNVCTEATPNLGLNDEEEEPQLDTSSIVCIPERPKKYVDPKTGEAYDIIEGDRALLKHPTDPSIGVCDISTGDKLVVVSNFKNFDSKLFPGELEEELNDSDIVARIKGGDEYGEWVITVDYSKSSGDVSNQNIASIAYGVATHMPQRSPEPKEQDIKDASGSPEMNWHRFTAPSF